ALTGNGSYEVPAEGVLRRLGPVIAEHATAFAYVLGALERLVTPPLEIAVVGPDAHGTDAVRREGYGRLLPASVTGQSAPHSGSALPPRPADRALVAGKPTAYVCDPFACRQPVTTPEDLREEIDAALAARRGG